MLPNCLIIGAQRCGTTWLYRCLKEHPSIAAPIKEVHFFDRYWNRGLEWYEALYQNCTDFPVLVDATPVYMSSAESVERMASILPHAKLIAVLRNPVDRVYSEYWHRNMQLKRNYQHVTFEEALKKHPELLLHGLYVRHLHNVLEHYSRDQLLLMLFDDLETDDKEFIRRVYGWLDVNDGFQPPLIGHTYNAVHFPRIQKLLRRLHLWWLARLAKRAKFDLIIRRQHRISGKQGYAEMKDPTRQYLQNYYSKPNEELQDLIGAHIEWS